TFAFWRICQRACRTEPSFRSFWQSPEAKFVRHSLRKFSALRVPLSPLRLRSIQPQGKQRFAEKFVEKARSCTGGTQSLRRETIPLLRRQIRPSNSGGTMTNLKGKVALIT